MINLGKVQEWENIEKTKISSFPSVPQVSQSTDDAKRSLEQSSSLVYDEWLQKELFSSTNFLNAKLVCAYLWI